jgi:hypothetical protein
MSSMSNNLASRSIVIMRNISNTSVWRINKVCLTLLKIKNTVKNFNISAL